MAFNVRGGLDFGGGVSLAKGSHTQAPGLYVTGGLRLSDTIGGSSGRGLFIDQTINASVGANAFGVDIRPTIVEAASGTHVDLIASLVLPAFTAGGASATRQTAFQVNGFTATSGTTDASAIRVGSAPSGATRNYALWVSTGDTRLDGPIVTEAANTTTALALVNQTATTSDVLALTLASDDAANGVDGDRVYMSFILDDDGQNQTEFVQLGGVAVDTGAGAEDGAFRVSCLDGSGPTMTDVFEIGFNTSGTFVMAFGAAVGTPVAAINFTNNEGTEDFTLDDSETTLNNQQVLGALINTLINLGLIS